MSDGPSEFYKRARGFLIEIPQGVVQTNDTDFANKLAELLCQEFEKGYWEGRREKLEEIKKVLKE